MARWKLTEAHYLNVPGTKWEYTEVERVTGRPKRTQFDVPLHLDPKQEVDWNYRFPDRDGEIIVCYEGKGEPKDIVFVGPPTTGMLPLDDEAKEISAKFDWTPTQGMDPESKAESYTEKLLNGLIGQMAEIQAGATQIPQAAGLDEFMKSMQDMMKQQTEILMLLAQKSTQPARRL